MFFALKLPAAAAGALFDYRYNLITVRYSQEHKSQTRGRIVTAAAREFRRRGAGAVGVVDIMQRVGLTQGGFYRHFRSKNALLHEAFRTALIEVANQLLQLTQDLPKEQALERVIGFYLSEEHATNPQHGCAFAALAAELVRSPKRNRGVIVRSLDAYRQRLLSLLPGRTEGQRTVAFEVLFPAMAGCLIAARLQVDAERRTEYLNRARHFFVNSFCTGAAS